MRPRHIVSAALAAGLAATALAVPARAAHPAEPADAAQPAPAVEVPAVVLLAGAAPTTVTVTVTVTRRQAATPTARGITGVLLAAFCGDTVWPCPPPPAPPADWTGASGFAVLKQPHPSVDQHATPAVGPTTPALLRLHHVRPRSELPAGRTPHLDPRPA